MTNEFVDKCAMALLIHCADLQESIEPDVLEQDKIKAWNEGSERERNYARGMVLSVLKAARGCPDWETMIDVAVKDSSG